MHIRVGLIVLACVCSTSQAQLEFFSDDVAFAAFSQQQGKFIKGIETFEYADVEQGAKLPFPNPLQAGVPRPGFEHGLLSPNLIIQSNITPFPSPPTTNPSANAAALWVNGAGFLGSNSIKVGTDEFLYGLFSSLDLIFTSDDKTSVGFDVSTYAGFDSGHAGFLFTVYDQFDSILGTYLMPGMSVPEPNKNFFGVWSSTPIGRINVWGIFDVPQPFAVDNIQMWVVPSPGALGLLAIGGLYASRRRR